MSKVRPPAVYPNYPAQQWSWIVDKTGAVYQTISGRLVAGGPWGIYVFRTAPTQKPQQIYFMPDGSGHLVVNYKKLYLLCTDAQWQEWIVEIDGYIDPDDTPSSQIVNVDEAQVAGLKMSIDTTQQQTQQAMITASSARSDVRALQSTVKQLQQQIDTQQNAITALQQQVAQLLTPSQVSDLVWQKIKDVNYLYRLAFISWPVTAGDMDIGAYVNDLVNLIRKVGKP